MLTFDVGDIVDFYGVEGKVVLASTGPVEKQIGVEFENGKDLLWFKPDGKILASQKESLLRLVKRGEKN